MCTLRARRRGTPGVQRQTLASPPASSRSLNQPRWARVVAGGRMHIERPVFRLNPNSMKRVIWRHVEVVREAVPIAQLLLNLGEEDSERRVAIVGRVEHTSSRQFREARQDSPT